MILLLKWDSRPATPPGHHSFPQRQAFWMGMWPFVLAWYTSETDAETKIYVKVVYLGHMRNQQGNDKGTGRQWIKPAITVANWGLIPWRRFREMAWMDSPNSNGSSEQGGSWIFIHGSCQALFSDYQKSPGKEMRVLHLKSAQALWSLGPEGYRWATHSICYLHSGSLPAGRPDWKDEGKLHVSKRRTRVFPIGSVQRLGQMFSLRSNQRNMLKIGNPSKWHRQESLAQCVAKWNLKPRKLGTRSNRGESVTKTNFRLRVPCRGSWGQSERQVPRPGPDLPALGTWAWVLLAGVTQEISTFWAGYGAWSGQSE